MKNENMNAVQTNFTTTRDAVNAAFARNETDPETLYPLIDAYEAALAALLRWGIPHAQRDNATRYVATMTAALDTPASVTPKDLREIVSYLLDIDEPARTEQQERSHRWAQMLADRDAGKRVAIDEETFDYFLDVLPPVTMGATHTLIDGTARRTAFGFAEGAERVTAFWSERDGDTRRYYMQHTTQISTGY